MKPADWTRTVLALTVIAAMTLVMVPAAPAANSNSFSSNFFEWDVADIPTTALVGISAVGPDDAWVVGSTGGSTGCAYHFDGTTWHNTAPLPSGTGVLYGVSAVDAQNVWAVGDDGLGGGRLIHYDGSAWHTDAATSFTLYSVYAMTPNEVFAVGNGIEHLWGGTWHDESPAGAGTLQGVHALDSQHAWAVGYGGTDQIYFYDGSTWTGQYSGGAFLRSVFALDTNRVWAVGSGGTSIFYNGTSWANNPIATMSNLSGVFALDPNHLFMSSGDASDQGGINYWDGVHWNATHTTSSSQALSGVTATDPNHIWAVGGSKVYSGRKAPDATANTYYFAEGTCRPNFDSYICMQNPDPLEASVTITYMRGNGTVLDQPLTIPGRSRTTVRASDVLGSGDDEAHDWSARVHCTSGTAIVAERPMYFNYRGAWTGGHDVVGALNPQPTFYFAEGSCRPQFDPYLCIQNPGSTAADVKITYMRGNGSTTEQHLIVPANKRSTVVVKDTLGEGDDEAHDFSAKVETSSSTPIVAERPMYFNYRPSSSSGATAAEGQQGASNQLGTQLGWTGGHDVIGTPVTGRQFYFAEGSCRPGFDSYICIQNPGDSPAEVIVDYYLGNGFRDRQGIQVPPRKRETLNVNDKLGTADDDAHDFSAVVYTTDGNQIVVERPMYFNYQGTKTGGHDVVGALYPAGTYYFAEGTCRSWSDPYICIQNPGTRSVPVRITYMLGSGGPRTQDVTVSAGSRYTVSVKGFLGSADDPAHDFSAQVTSTSARHDAIVVERPMYFNYSGAWTGGHDVIGYTP